jgi:hypothetical protein
MTIGRSGFGDLSPHPLRLSPNFSQSLKNPSTPMNNLMWRNPVRWAKIHKPPRHARCDWQFDGLGCIANGPWSIALAIDKTRSMPTLPAEMTPPPAAKPSLSRRIGLVFHITHLF